jgi:hypothetical protein
MTDQIADARPPTRADLLREQAELWRTDMADGGYVAHGAAKQLADVLQAAIEEVATLRAERDRLQRTVASVAMMLGWGNVPPQDTLERDIAALKARVADATALRARDAQLEQALTAVHAQFGPRAHRYGCDCCGRYREDSMSCAETAELVRAALAEPRR